jgi:BMFP domain-containing protein YqiC
MGVDLETRCDKTGEVQTIALLREDREALQKRVEELEATFTACAPSVSRLTKSRARREFYASSSFRRGAKNAASRPNV